MSDCSPVCSFIVSVLDRAEYLRCVLSSLAIQTERRFEVLVTDNAITPEAASRNRAITEEFISRDPRFIYLPTALPSCYHSAEAGAKHSAAEFLCFPSDDGYYIPTFLERMLSLGTAWDLIYCDCLYGHAHRGYFAMDVQPRLMKIDKGGFLVRREMFDKVGGFREKKPDRCMADGQFIEAVMRSRPRHVKIPGLLWVHNP